MVIFENPMAVVKKKKKKTSQAKIRNASFYRDRQCVLCLYNNRDKRHFGANHHVILYIIIKYNDDRFPVCVSVCAIRVLLEFRLQPTSMDFLKASDRTTIGISH